MWLATRSNSRAMPRRTWPRAGTRVRAEGLDGAAIGGGVAGRGIAGERFRVVDGPRVGTADHRPLHAAMLIAQRDFQVIDRFAVALEAEMARLDDAGVDRADGHFVDLFARHPEEVGRCTVAAGTGPASPDVAASAEGRPKADAV